MSPVSPRVLLPGISNRQSSAQSLALWPRPAVAPRSTNPVCCPPQTNEPYTPTPNSFCELMRSQLQSVSMMSTSSQYYRSASAHSRFQTIPANDHEHLYPANLASIWQGQPYAGPSSVYPQAGVSSDFVTPSNPSAWPPGYPRQNFHGWGPGVSEQSFAPRTGYDDAEVSAPVPHANPAVARQYQQPANPRPALPLSTPVNTFQGAEQLSLRLSPVVSIYGASCFTLNTAKRPKESPANALDPPFPNQNQTTHTISRLPHSRSQTSSLHLDNSHTSLRLPVSWDTRSHVTPVGLHHYPSQVSNAVSCNTTAPEHSVSTSTLWPTVNPSERHSSSAVYEQTHDGDQQWSLVQSQLEHGACQHSQAHVNLVPDLVAHQPSNPKPPPKKKPAKVPSSFIERQEKLKVSKRKGPLQDKQREKTHTMRKTKRICVRCRFYKSGVCTLWLIGVFD